MCKCIKERSIIQVRGCDLHARPTWQTIGQPLHGHHPDQSKNSQKSTGKNAKHTFHNAVQKKLCSKIQKKMSKKRRGLSLLPKVWLDAAQRLYTEQWLSWTLVQNFETQALTVLRFSASTPAPSSFWTISTRFPNPTCEHAGRVKSHKIWKRIATAVSSKLFALIAGHSYLIASNNTIQNVTPYLTLRDESFYQSIVIHLALPSNFKNYHNKEMLVFLT